MSVNMVLLVKKLMEHIGLNPGRLRLQHMSGAEANVFVESTNDFIKNIKELGPIGKSEGLSKEDLNTKIAEVSKLIPYFKVVYKEKLSARVLNHDEYDKVFTKEEVEKVIKEVPAYYIEPEKCQACMTCARRCPADAIISAKQEVHIVVQDKCIKCGTCFEVCPPKFRAITKIVGSPVPPPLPEGKRAVVRKSKEKEVA
jgi:F420-non-reducing hydrogenase iron-sulfur subunit